MKADLRNEENHNNGTHRQLTHSWNVLRGAERPDTWIRATARRRLTVSLILVAGDLYQFELQLDTLAANVCYRCRIPSISRASCCDGIVVLKKLPAEGLLITLPLEPQQWRADLLAEGLRVPLPWKAETQVLQRWDTHILVATSLQLTR